MYSSGRELMPLNFPFIQLHCLIYSDWELVPFCLIASSSTIKLHWCNIYHYSTTNMLSLLFIKKTLFFGAYITICSVCIMQLEIKNCKNIIHSTGHIKHIILLPTPHLVLLLVVYTVYAHTLG